MQDRVADVASHADETLHEVTLTQPFHLGAYPVTVGDFNLFGPAVQIYTARRFSDHAPVIVDYDYELR